ncbi:hypothetical protein CEXT_617061 [Caerostris extrusa]|uniref:Uncharacterized protein n=1 Tax=Caerostris extrusa TaxID=172846 RepID=A0AAV4XUD0_CAEEX|nr:hypothetical protein CEXT_617061 [Caerostris extrusa]
MIQNQSHECKRLELNYHKLKSSFLRRNGLPNPCAALQVQLMGLGFRLGSNQSSSLPSDEVFPLKIDAKIFGRHSISLFAASPLAYLYTDSICGKLFFPFIMGIQNRNVVESLCAERIISRPLMTLKQRRK